jgi:hypothetical protein
LDFCLFLLLWATHCIHNSEVSDEDLTVQFHITHPLQLHLLLVEKENTPSNSIKHYLSDKHKILFDISNIFIKNWLSHNTIHGEFPHFIDLCNAIINNPKEIPLTEEFPTIQAYIIKYKQNLEGMIPSSSSKRFKLLVSASKRFKLLVSASGILIIFCMIFWWFKGI